MNLIGKRSLHKHQKCWLAKQPAWDIVMTDLNGMAFLPFLDFKRSMMGPSDIALSLMRPSVEKQWRG